MIEPGQVLAVALAAGLARRFGSDKLAHRIGEHSVLEAALAPLDPFAWLGRAVVMQPARAREWKGVGDPIINDAPERGMGHSLALAAAAADRMGAEFLLVTLGDMPCVSAQSLSRLLSACPDTPDALAALVARGNPPGPPALFGRAWFPLLATADGENGARALLRDPAHALITVDLPFEEAMDIDAPGDIGQFRPEG